MDDFRAMVPPIPEEARRIRAAYLRAMEERRILTTPGVAEGFEEAQRVVKTWRSALSTTP